MSQSCKPVYDSVTISLCLDCGIDEESCIKPSHLDNFCYGIILFYTHGKTQIFHSGSSKSSYT